MRIRLACLGALSIAVLLGLISMPNVAAQEKAQKAQKADKADKKGAAEKANVQGTVQNMSKETSTITVRTGTGQVTRQVMYDAKTKFLYGHSDNNKPGAVAQVKEQNYISCVGTFNDKSQLMATECVYRESK
ncbi:MAG TPA: hypothetical protein VKK06_11450 [Terriglobia bacterium]|nr:hypothetical protein [Terriglobia bacterium]